MDKKNFLKKIIIILIGISIIFYSLSSAINKVTSDKTYYYKYSKEENLKEYVGVEQNKLEKMYDSLIDYINSGDENLINKIFNSKEILHMKDVYELYEINRLINWITFFSIFIYLTFITFFSKENNEIKSRDIKTLQNTVLISLLIFLILAIIISTNFDKYFIKFHHIFFNNDLWLLNPETDIMIRMLPQDYFMKLAMKIATRFAIYIIIIQAVINLIKKFELKKIK